MWLTASVCPQSFLACPVIDKVCNLVSVKGLEGNAMRMIVGDQSSIGEVVLEE